MALSRDLRPTPSTAIYIASNQVASLWCVPLSSSNILFSEPVGYSASRGAIASAADDAELGL